MMSQSTIDILYMFPALIIQSMTIRWQIYFTDAFKFIQSFSFELMKLSDYYK